MIEVSQRHGIFLVNDNQNCITSHYEAKRQLTIEHYGLRTSMHFVEFTFLSIIHLVTSASYSTSHTRSASSMSRVLSRM